MLYVLSSYKWTGQIPKILFSNPEVFYLLDATDPRISLIVLKLRDPIQKNVIMNMCEIIFEEYLVSVMLHYCISFYSLYYCPVRCIISNTFYFITFLII